MVAAASAARFTERNGRLGQRKRLNGLTRVEILLSYLARARARAELRETRRRPIISRYITFPHDDE